MEKDNKKFFPKFKESEDERVRKAILTGLIDCRDAPDLGWSDFGGITIDECINWLEKQVNTSDKVTCTQNTVITELIDKSTIIIEIEKRQKEEVFYDEDGSFASWADQYRYSILESIKKFIDTLK